MFEMFGMFLLSLFVSTDWFLTWSHPQGFYAIRAVSPPVIDGRMDDEVWRQAHWSADFVDITGDPNLTPRYRTTMAWVWDDSALYVAAVVEDPHIWASFAKHDASLYRENNFEIFFDPDGDNHSYAEVEINALNTVFDLLMERPYRDAGRAAVGWDVAGLQTAVAVDGSVNNPGDMDRSWTVEMRLPWSGLRQVGGITGAPTEGTQWRVNASRVQWNHTVVNGAYVKSRSEPESNWVWAPQGKIDMHQPERWGVLEFRGEAAKDMTPTDPLEAERRDVMEAYHAQKKFEKIHQRCALDMIELSSVLDRQLNGFMRVEITDEGWQVRLPLSSNVRGPEMVVGADSRLRREER